MSIAVQTDMSTPALAKYVFFSLNFVSPEIEIRYLLQYTYTLSYMFTQFCLIMM